MKVCFEDYRKILEKLEPKTPIGELDEEKKGVLEITELIKHILTTGNKLVPQYVIAEEMNKIANSLEMTKKKKFAFPLRDKRFPAWFVPDSTKPYYKRENPVKLKQIDEKHSKTYERFLYIFNDILLITSKIRTLNGEKYRIKHQIRFYDLNKITEINSDEKVPYTTFLMVSTNHSFIFTTENKEFLNDLNRVINDYKRQSKDSIDMLRIYCENHHVNSMKSGKIFKCSSRRKQNTANNSLSADDEENIQMVDISKDGRKWNKRKYLSLIIENNNQGLLNFYHQRENSKEFFNQSLSDWIIEESCYSDSILILLPKRNSFGNKLTLYIRFGNVDACQKWLYNINKYASNDTEETGNNKSTVRKPEVRKSILSKLFSRTRALSNSW
ncbi:DgyrCDS14097 [Dimorphilus gyrociliatus]|uniref:DgyrCDS14097 n=1 Tax=Dimorphilus gyrociliatus TaxID=2664684 RepID=A0A7I8WCL3_9ANNE|nr:DgyrCDS14097 [Dimorphilus gyrociliatus]